MIVIVAVAEPSTAPVFSFHLTAEPGSIDPARAGFYDSSYLLSNLYRGLYRYDVELHPDEAESCQWQSARRLTCHLRAGLKWSDGTALIAEDYARAFRRMVAPSAAGSGAELLTNVRGARDVFAGRLDTEKLGVRAIGMRTLQFDFVKNDPDFLFKLSSSLLAPARTDTYPAPGPGAASLVVNGPYKLVSWTPGRRIRLERNSEYSGLPANQERPPVEIYFVDDDETAVDLYRKGTLRFLRRLPTTYIPAYKGRPDFYQTPMMRFDYIGFGPALKDLPKAREAFSKSMDFAELARIYSALGIPGCPSIPESFMDHAHCIVFDPVAAKAAWATLPESVRVKKWTYKFSKLGGDDLRKSAEWMQGQWKKNLGANVVVEQVENKSYLAELRENPPDLFRKGVGLDRPTCLAALETFAPDSAENYLRVDLPKYQALLKRLAALDPKSIDAKKACGDGVRMLLERYLLVPQGRIHFTLLASPQFAGWHLNEMNQLDLASLRATKDGDEGRSR